MNPRRHIVGLLTLLAVLGCGAGCARYGPSADASLDRLRTDRHFDQEPNQPPSAHTLYTMARLLGAEGRATECESALVRCIQQYPHFMPAYCDLAELYLSRRRLDEALRVLNAGLRVSPQDPVLLNNLGMCILVGGRYREALDLFTEAAGIAPGNARYRANMAVALGMMGRYAEALSLYEQIMSSSDAHHNLAILCEAKNDKDLAREERGQAGEGQERMDGPP